MRKHNAGMMNISLPFIFEFAVDDTPIRTAIRFSYNRHIISPSRAIEPRFMPCRRAPRRSQRISLFRKYFSPMRRFSFSRTLAAKPTTTRVGTGRHYGHANQLTRAARRRRPTGRPREFRHAAHFYRATTSQAARLHNAVPFQLLFTRRSEECRR